MLQSWQQNEEKITKGARKELIHLFQRKVKFIMMMLQLSRRATERLYAPGGDGAAEAAVHFRGLAAIPVRFAS